ncbi:MAG TPA: TIM barrel protein [Devosia sp.]|nr:TIM barrel protein [Devosia sp.]
MAELRFALNHMVAPQLGLRQFFALARQLGLEAVEIRNDLAGQPLPPAAEVRRLAAEQSITILSINALQKFNHWSPERAREAEALAHYCRDCGAQALVLVAANDGTGMGDGERVANAVEALRGLEPILAANGIVGLVECLGFEACSLRRKSEAVEAIEAVGGAGRFRLTHDTFHHHLAGEAAMFPELTGLVHISGVDNPGVPVSAMRDGHRVLVGPRDRLGNVAQIRALAAAGYAGPLSFEPFAEELRALSDPARAVAESIGFIRSELAAKAA